MLVSEHPCAMENHRHGLTLGLCGQEGGLRPGCPAAVETQALGCPGPSLISAAPPWASTEHRASALRKWTKQPSPDLT